MSNGNHAIVQQQIVYTHLKLFCMNLKTALVKPKASSRTRKDSACTATIISCARCLVCIPHIAGQNRKAFDEAIHIL